MSALPTAAQPSARADPLPWRARRSGVQCAAVLADGGPPRAWSSSGLDPTVSHYLLHAESAGREVWRLYKQRPREASADDAEEGSRCEEEDGGDMAPVRKNAAGDIVRDERRDAHVQAEIVAAQAAAQAVVRDGKTEQQRREEEAAEAAAAEMKRAEAAAAAKSSFVATAFRAPGPKVCVCVRVVCCVMW